MTAKMFNVSYTIVRLHHKKLVTKLNTFKYEWRWGTGYTLYVFYIKYRKPSSNGPSILLARVRIGAARKLAHEQRQISAHESATRYVNPTKTRQGVDFWGGDLVSLRHISIVNVSWTHAGVVLQWLGVFNIAHRQVKNPAHADFWLYFWIYSPRNRIGYLFGSFASNLIEIAQIEFFCGILLLEQQWSATIYCGQHGLNSQSKSPGKICIFSWGQFCW